MNAITSRPPLPAAITGCDDGPARLESICSGGWKAPPTRRVTKTCATPETSFRYTSAPVPSRAIDMPLRPTMSGLGPSRTVAGPGTGAAGAARAASGRPADAHTSNASASPNRLDALRRHQAAPLEVASSGRGLTEHRTGEPLEGCARAAGIREVSANRKPTLTG